MANNSPNAAVSVQSPTHQQALACLRELVGHPEAQFHDGQFEAIEALVDAGRRTLVVQRTGWGKSAVYFVASLLLRRRGAGPTLIVSPLLALMRDQVAAAARAGVRAVAINSANALEWDTVLAQLAADEVDVLLVSPERLTNPSFRENQLPELIRRTGLLVIDEAHCISDWGHDFRPDYRRIADLIAQLPDSVPVLATTATANSRVVHDIEEQLGAGVLTIRGALGRESLRLGVLTLPDSRDRLGWLLTHLADMPGSGIIYTLTVSAAEDTARLLAEAGHNVLSYTGRTDPADRERAEQLLKENQVKALVATSALGMGFDKPDLGFVIHLGAPSSPVAYYQQVGRAGRGAANADVLLLPGSEDREIWQYFATASMPSAEKADAVLSVLGEAGSALSTVALEARVDLRRTPLELLLKVLAVDGAVERVGGGWKSTGTAWNYDAERYARIAEARVDEQDSMVIYQDTAGCRMEFITSVLDDETAAACGRCDNCAGRWFPVDVSASAADAAGQTLRRAGIAVEPRLQWPSGMDRLGVAVKGKIKPDESLSEGRILARLTDLGWGGALRELFAAGAPDRAVDPAMLQACVQVLREWSGAEGGTPWSGVGRPAAVVSIPSRSKPHLVESLAQGIAGIGRMPYLGQLQPQHGGPTGARGGNSAYRLAGVWDRLIVGPELAQALAGTGGQPVLLVDDIIDSRWTMTVSARALRHAGVGAVLPLALAQAG
ncbi:RecQ family ATP-dependent DNA helicase [Paenarthrobacter aurescens]|uniref:DNA 3'-5' helicase n=1 Tax=Paenarthrobacter aurescens TaxID=43663 RepID=A0A4Y3NJI8_PAEAU|nr:RecQ family ATP-dependent DNA helicase [Paenarthrobacter aurescens]MDO6142438.1 RecQ family ATP-dependent DNA helicase [Paenarthrobacter aurescens]MDO6146285.1 RecQ family ATP-dependent DNA helicase [Paenarthrobacter aurescens]MDO6157530.1 RecQ family ATP-dependent DNA helicase [Paenarthrobacter aurescens]MDO6161515.1 RecQ family ATP-dependent DNA helicase [Paenarthrobacter aurescens]GEB20625.1 ATP-dependent DNA helicase RecQ [Paenarthrobacter aurescens]